MSHYARGDTSLFTSNKHTGNTGNIGNTGSIKIVYYTHCILIYLLNLIIIIYKALLSALLLYLYCCTILGTIVYL